VLPPNVLGALYSVGFPRFPNPLFDLKFNDSILPPSFVVSLSYSLGLEPFFPLFLRAIYRDCWAKNPRLLWPPPRQHNRPPPRVLFSLFFFLPFLSNFFFLFPLSFRPRPCTEGNRSPKCQFFFSSDSPHSSVTASFPVYEASPPLENGLSQQKGPLTPSSPYHPLFFLTFVTTGFPLCLPPMISVIDFPCGCLTLPHSLSVYTRRLPFFCCPSYVFEQELHFPPFFRPPTPFAA